MRETLPTGWVETSFESVLFSISNGIVDKQNKEGKGIPVTRIETISDGTLNCDKIGFVDNFPNDKLDKYVLTNGDILFSHINSPIHLGKTAIVKDLKIKLYHGTNLLLLRTPKLSSLPYFFEFYCRFYRYLGEFSKNAQHAVNQSSLNQKKIKSFLITLPPLNEQKRIVAKLDAIIPRIDSLKARMDKIPTLIKRFRQSVLTAAITGKLTEKWRDEHSGVDSAEVSVRKIYEDRIKECKTISQKEKVKSFFSEVEDGDSKILPETWQFIFLNKICESFQYGTSSKSEKTGKVAVLRMGNLQNGKIDWSDLAYTSSEEEIKKYKLKKNSVLFNRTNSPELVGKASIYLGDQKAIFAGYLIKINNLEILDSHYLNFALNTNYAKAFCNREKTDGVSQSNINAQKLGRFEIPLPPLEEQKEIVRQVEKLFAIADKLEVHYQNAKARIDKLSQSILAKAFRGELVPQDPNDEPAEKLLKRIMEEKAKMESTLKVGKKKGVRQKTKARSRK